MDKKQIDEKIRKEASAKIEKYLKQGKDGGEIACPICDNPHARLILIKSGKRVIICLECGHDEIG